MLRSWWIQSGLPALESAETRLLALTGVKRYDVPVGNGLHIHTLEGGQTKHIEGKPPLILLHGYGQGAAAFFLNLPQLTENLHVYAKDWMGYGASSRPKFSPVGVEQTEEFFVEHMEAWRKAQGLNKMILCGHSLGGYLSFAYAERYPQHVDKLILVSPVGVPHPSPEFEKTIAGLPFQRRMLFSSLTWLWTKGVTPGDLVRGFGPVGRRMMEGYAQRRFRSEGALDKAAFGDYLYHNAASTHGSGERALSQLLLPFAWARKPLCERIPKLDKSIPIYFIYGTQDWMDARNAVEVKKTTPKDQTLEVYTIEDAGKHFNYYE